MCVEALGCLGRLCAVIPCRRSQALINQCLANTITEPLLDNSLSTKKRKDSWVLEKWHIEKKSMSLC